MENTKFCSSNRHIRESASLLQQNIRQSANFSVRRTTRWERTYRLSSRVGPHEICPVSQNRPDCFADFPQLFDQLPALQRSTVNSVGHHDDR